MHKRRVILVDDKEWGDIRVEALKRCISAGQYLVDLHNKEKVRDSSQEVKKEIVTEKRKIYTEEYRKKNPMENCKVCGKSLKFNCSH
jgi:hypothetical protein